MSEVATFVRVTTRQMSRKRLDLPEPVFFACKALTTLRRAWHFWRIGKIYTNPKNFLSLSAGHGLRVAFGDSLVLRVSAVCVLIATRMLECVEQQNKLQKTWRQLVFAIRGNFATPVKCPWKTTTCHGFFSVSSIIGLQYGWKSCLCRIQRIAACILQVGKQVFLLSMRMMDAIDTFSLSPSTQNEGINTLFVNSTKWIDKLVENKELLVSGLKANKKIIAKVLRVTHVPLTTETLIKTASNALDKVEKVHRMANKASHTFGGFVLACAKKWGKEFLYELGFHHVVPHSCVPSVRPPWERQRTVPRLPKKWLIKPSAQKKQIKKLHRTKKLRRALPQKQNLGDKIVYLVQQLFRGGKKSKKPLIFKKQILN